MKALQLEKPQSWQRIDIAEPRQPGPGEALLRVHRIGICGTDISAFLSSNWSKPHTRGKTPPMFTADLRCKRLTCAAVPACCRRDGEPNWAARRTPPAGGLRSTILLHRSALGARTTPVLL